MPANRSHLIDRIFDLKDPDQFPGLALEVFQYQYEQVAAYREFCELIDRSPSNVMTLEEIPFLPIELFKARSIRIDREPEIVFSSSGTTGATPSQHEVVDLELYRRSFLAGFERVYGPTQDWVILALLPSYLEREGSSLIYMTDELIRRTDHPDSGFYLYDHESLLEVLDRLETKQQKTILIGVSYALLDLIETRSSNLSHTRVMETGGMKGRRKEWIKSTLHQVLKEGFGVDQIHSEYGMTELLSQAYSTGEGLYTCPPWMQVRTRDPEDPFAYVTNKTGGINVIDLANLDSCAFIATQDLGKCHPDGSFEILGRFDSSDLRGCNLMLF